ncbi:sensor histidine kinase [Polyangium mundeleinium]|uniref:histidine kinase n=1 Tax=Polyangium mundeleinium TaxID=2995306 RepID=A0ABT5EPV0_9BACT|nr:HAMP domain-containing sensor histidine kinase [Polyangium mundeleinium]MDC0743848.1 HAMP domain-containing sensor histidine kinase [Polyangium mundeleinium]
MLTERAARLRDLLLFVTLALLPSIAVGVLGLRAVEGEEAAQRREAQSALDFSAERLRLRVEQALAEADVALAAARFGPDLQDAERTLAGIVPPFAAPLLLDRDRALALPAAPPASAASPASTPHCNTLAATFTTTKNPGARKAARKELLDLCPDVRGAGGRFLYPVVALSNLSESEAPALVAWIEGHASSLAPGEREATREEITTAAALGEALRARALLALKGSPSTRGRILEALRSEEAATALRGGPDRAGMLRFRAPGAIFVLRALDDGRLAGLVVLGESLAASLDAGFPAMQPGERALFAPTVSSFGDLRGTTLLSPGLAMHVVPVDRTAIDRRAARSRRVLAAIGGGAVALSLGLLALLWARMRAARRTSELRVDFVSAVSHELRTPVSSVRMFAELLESGRVEPEEQHEVFEALARESKRLGDTVERMLSLGRMAKGRLAAVRAEADLATVADEALLAFEERFPDVPAIERAIDAPAPAHVDPGLVRLALDNLLDNARKYAPDGAPYRLVVRRADEGITIRVEDRGPGISRRDQKRIFEPFERLDDKLSRETEGSGLGLSLVRHVMRAHGGTARVESEPGRGATFLLIFPGRKG